MSSNRADNDVQNDGAVDDQHPIEQQDSESESGSASNEESVSE